MALKKGEDTEYLHKMRVASRRIRAAMPLFKSCYQKKQFKNWLTEIKRVTTFLGEARDLDVQIIFLQDYIKSQPLLDSNSGVKLLLDSLASRRAKIQATVINELDELRNSGVLKEIKKVSNQILNPNTERISVCYKMCWKKQMVEYQRSLTISYQWKAVFIKKMIFYVTTK